MSLNEWKNNELNMLLMKKWGLLKEEKGGSGDEHYQFDKKEREDELEEGAFGFKSASEKRKELADRPEFSAGGPQEDDPGVDPPTAWALQKGEDEKLPKDTRTRRPARRFDTGGRAAGSRNVFSMGEDMDLDEGHEHGPECGCPDQELEEGWGYRDDDLDASSDRRLAYEKDPVMGMSVGDMEDTLDLSPEDARATIDWGPGEREHDRGPEDGPGLGKARHKLRKAFAGQFKEGKISVREAKEITRRIVERIKKESK